MALFSFMAFPWPVVTNFGLIDETHKFAHCRSHKVSMPYDFCLVIGANMLVYGLMRIGRLVTLKSVASIPSACRCGLGMVGSSGVNLFRLLLSWFFFALSFVVVVGHFRFMLG